MNKMGKKMADIADTISMVRLMMFGNFAAVIVVVMRNNTMPQQNAISNGHQEYDRIFFKHHIRR